jgi:hypothetical protein
MGNAQMGRMRRNQFRKPFPVFTWWKGTRTLTARRSQRRKMVALLAPVPRVAMADDAQGHALGRALERGEQAEGRDQCADKISDACPAAIRAGLPAILRLQ